MKGEYMESLEGRIEAWVARLEALEARAADADPESKAEYEERIDELWTRVDAARVQCERLREVDDGGWDAQKTEVDRAWLDLEEAYSDFEREVARV